MLEDLKDACINNIPSDDLEYSDERERGVPIDRTSRGREIERLVISSKKKTTIDHTDIYI